MTQNKIGFSKLTKEEKINWIAQNHFANPKQAIEVLHQYKNSDEALQKLHDGCGACWHASRGPCR